MIWRRPTTGSWGIEQAGENAVQGSQRSGGQTVHFYALLNARIEQLEVQKEGDRGGRAIVRLQGGNGRPVEMKIGLSFVSAQNAKQNLATEIGRTSFDEVRAAARQTWEALLSDIQVEGGTAKQKELFYTSLYRAFLWPALRSDANGEFRDVKGEVAEADFNYYTKPSLWDTYRNKLVLLEIMSPDVTGEVIRSLQDVGEKTGFIPTFFHGDHAAPFIAGAYAKGLDDYDVEKVYQLLLGNATKEGGTRPYIAEYMEKGYISTPEVASPEVETKAKAGVSKTLEYAYDDYAVAQLAKALGLYPFSPADDEYLVTVPLFDRVRWRLDGGRELIINKPQEGRALQYVRVNGEKIDGYVVSHDLFRRGGEVDVVTD